MALVLFECLTHWVVGRGEQHGIAQNHVTILYLSEKQLVASLMDLFAAGTETVATTIMWSFVFLFENPDVLKKVQEEIDHNVGHERILTNADRGDYKARGFSICTSLWANFRLNLDLNWLEFFFGLIRSVVALYWSGSFGSAALRQSRTAGNSTSKLAGDHGRRLHHTQGHGYCGEFIFDPSWSALVDRAGEIWPASLLG